MLCGYEKNSAVEVGNVVLVCGSDGELVVSAAPSTARCGASTTATVAAAAAAATQNVEALPCLTALQSAGPVTAQFAFETAGEGQCDSV